MLCAFAADADTIDHTDRLFVNDYADVMSDADEQAVFEIGKKLYEDTGAQIALLTVDDLGGMDIRDFGYKVGESWAFGYKDKDNGVLMVFSMGDRKYSIEVGYGLEGAIPDITTTRIREDIMLPLFKEDDYSGGLREGYKQLAALVYKEQGMETPDGLSGTEVVSAEEEEISDAEFYLALGVVIILLLIILLPVGIVMRAGRGGGGYRGGGGGFGGGGFGGGSGGGFGGGGGGGFSGGGGSFGGGGSSGSF